METSSSPPLFHGNSTVNLSVSYICMSQTTHYTTAPVFTAVSFYTHFSCSCRAERKRWALRILNDFSLFPLRQYHFMYKIGSPCRRGAHTVMHWVHAKQCTSHLEALLTSCRRVVCYWKHGSKELDTFWHPHTLLCLLIEFDYWQVPGDIISLHPVALQQVKCNIRRIDWTTEQHSENVYTVVSLPSKCQESALSGHSSARWMINESECFHNWPHKQISSQVD